MTPIGRVDGHQARVDQDLEEQFAKVIEDPCQRRFCSGLVVAPRASLEHRAFLESALIKQSSDFVVTT